MAIELEVVSNSRKAQSDLDRLKTTAISIRNALIKNVAEVKVKTKEIDEAKKKIEKLASVKDIKVKVSAEVKEAKKAIDSISASTSGVKPLKIQTQGVEKAKTDIDGLNTTVKSLATNIAISAAAFVSFSSAIRLSDSITNMESKLNVLAKTQRDAVFGFNAIKSIAASTRQPIEDISDLYTKLSMASQRLG